MGVSSRGDGWTIFDEYRFSTLSPFEDFVYSLYWSLDTERMVTEVGPRPIPRSRCSELFERLGLDEEESENVLSLIEELETRHFKWWREKATKERAEREAEMKRRSGD